MQNVLFGLSVELTNEIKKADTVLLGLPLYNYGPPSTVKAWVDHLIAPGLSIDPKTSTGLLGDIRIHRSCRARRRIRSRHTAGRLGSR